MHNAMPYTLLTTGKSTELRFRSKKPNFYFWYNTLNSIYFTLHTTHNIIMNYTLNSIYFTLRTAQYILHTSHYALYTTHYTMQTSQYTIHTIYFSLHNAN